MCKAERGVDSAAQDTTVSLVICAYNAERYFQECLESVSDQSVLPTELIIVDDGSTDATGAMADAYASSHAFCRVLHGQNEGLLLARRRGLSQCQGDYVMFLDSDDALRADAIETALRAALDNSADIVLFRASGKRDFSPTNLPPKPCRGVYKGHDELRSIILAGNVNSMWGKLFRRGLFDMDTSYSSYSGLMHGEDLLQLLPVFGAANTVAVIDEWLYYYRPNESSSTSSYKVAQRHDCFAVLNEASRYAEAWGLQPLDSSCWARNVTYLLSILFGDQTLGEAFTQGELESISAAARKFFIEGSGSLSSLRADYRLILGCLVSRRYRVLHALVTLRERIIG